MRVLTSLISLVVMSLVLLAAMPSQHATTGDRAYLPYGVPVPAHIEIERPPQPFNKKVHGPPLRNTIPHRNMAGHPGVPLRTRDHTAATGASPSPPFEPGSGDRGLWLTAGEGIYARNDARLNLSIPDAAIGTTIYAPTHMAPGDPCMETVTAHWRYAGMDATAHGHGFWDWCETDGTGAWQVFEFMDTQWTNQYVRRLRGERRYWTQVYKDEPFSWKGLLYNFAEGRWEEKTAISGVSVLGYGIGWSMWESHHLMDVAGVCPQFPDVQAGDLHVYIDAAWTRVSDNTSTDTLGPYGQCWIDGTYTFRLLSNGDTWRARTSK